MSDYWSYLSWKATYESGLEVKEDTSIPSHFMLLNPLGIKSLSYVDGLTSYLLDCKQGSFFINGKELELRADNLYIPPVGRLNTAILSPTEAYSKQGLFQFKKAGALAEKEKLALGIESYSLGFTVIVNNKLVSETLKIDAVSGNYSVFVDIHDLFSNQKSQYVFEKLVKGRKLLEQYHKEKDKKKK